METTNITQEDLLILLEKFEKKAYEAGPCEKGTLEYQTTKKIENLLKQDYKIIELDNTNGVLNPRYPCKIFIPFEKQSNVSTNNTQTSEPNNFPTSFFTTNVSMLQNCGSGLMQNVIYEELNDTTKTREIITTAKYARCRQRFVVPAIYFKGNYICRSSTLSVMPETYGRKVVDYAHNCIYGGKNQINHMEQDGTTDDIPFDSLYNPEPSPFSYEVVIKSDIELLKSLNVNIIVDLMVEKRKIKYFVAVSSSEKADPENHYKSFNILSLPYPGCEFFSKFRDNNYIAKNLHFDWTQNFIDASLDIPKTGPTIDLDLNWQDYRKWDLVLITQNYLKACLKYIQEENSGILVHCISGWDRTPLFISLLRLSLWADGLIHISLTPIQIAYFTLAYDWYQFGHQLPDRLTRGEEIMFFCFHVLKYITDEEFSLLEQRKRTKTASSSGSSSVIILKSDCCDDDSLKEEFFHNLDQDSNDSFANCDMSSVNNENFFSNNSLTNRSPNPKRSKTSPISVPEVNPAQRQRQESTSSNGSWQVVTETGSIDSIRNGSFMSRFIQQDQQQSYTNQKEKNFQSIRKQRLCAVRACFIQAYGKTIGLKFKEGTSMNLASFIGTIADQLF